MDIATVDDTVLEYEIRGSGEPVVLIHGAFISDAFRPLLDESSLVEHYEVIAYRRRGYGRSHRPTEPVTMARQATDCRGLMGRLGIERAHVVGHSYGGAIALQFARETPHAVHSLCLLEPALMVGSSGSEYRASLQRGVQRYRKEGAAPVVEDMLRARWGEDPRATLERVLPGAFDRAVEEAPVSFDFELPALLDWDFDAARLRDVDQPTLVVLGERSKDLSPRFVETYEILLDRLPNAEGYVLPGAAHGLQTQNPSGMANALAHFFARHPIRH